jgi:hypothetical protein
MFRRKQKFLLDDVSGSLVIPAGALAGTALAYRHD